MTKRRSDKARLDWLAKQKRAFGTWFGKGLLFVAEFPRHHRSVRKAIDAAMLAEERHEKESA